MIAANKVCSKVEIGCIGALVPRMCAFGVVCVSIGEVPIHMGYPINTFGAHGIGAVQ